ncbi:MAG: DUF484 family protein [Gammaproteobacteria bacterium]|nr:DUF484 family protein [Gammaproteobacteria bacterium]MDD9896502.1 DUF484 family protein [Gammaproteobacteria bacterium]MDD9958743.1 DUF484 family protein [Gammaproteobacteria bacterium]
MSNDVSAAEQVTDVHENEVSEDQVTEYLRSHPDFFARQEDLLAELSLPHESGKAISLLERQVTILRDRGIEARQKLNNLLENARNNDQLFDTTRNLVLALLRADSITEVANVTQDQLANHDNIDACEIIIVEHPDLNVSHAVRTESVAKLKTDFSDVFRLKRTHCGPLDQEQIAYLFPAAKNTIRSTALCPVINNSEVLAMLAFGNQTDNYFNVNLDTLFLDFMGHVVGAVLDRHLADIIR